MLSKVISSVDSASDPTFEIILSSRDSGRILYVVKLLIQTLQVTNFRLLEVFQCVASHNWFCCSIIKYDAFLDDLNLANIKIGQSGGTPTDYMRTLSKH